MSGYQGLCRKDIWLYITLQLLGEFGRVVDCWLFQMSLTIQQIILDAKRLAGRLKERETEADALLTETQTAYRQIYTIKQVSRPPSLANDVKLSSSLLNCCVS